ncbi:MAG: alpha/beta hydrolase [Myxococcales bacterium]
MPGDVAADGATTWLEVGPHRIESALFRPREARGGGPTLVLLHEGLGSVSLWRDFPQQLADATALPAFAYSRRGYGRSSAYPPPWPVRYMHDEAELLPEVLRAAGIGAHVLVGHSDGASIALLSAGGGGAPGLQALVLEAPHVFAEEVGLRSIAELRQAYAATGLKARLARHHRDPDNAFHGWNGAWLQPLFRAWNIEEALPGIRVPALILQGENDDYGTLAHATSIERRSGGPSTTVLVPRCGHSPHRDQPDAVIAAIVRFLGPRHVPA